MAVRILTVLLIIGIQSFIQIQSWPQEGDVCYIDSKAKLQVMFVIDQTLNLSKFQKLETTQYELGNATDYLIDNLNHIYPNAAEFAVSSFASFANRTRAHCYNVIQKFTTNATLAKQKAKIPFILSVGDSRSSLREVASATLDSTIGWKNQANEEEDVTLHKLIILVTDEYYFPRHPKTVTKFPWPELKDCKSATEPSLQTLSNILQQNTMSLIILNEKDYEGYPPMFPVKDHYRQIMRELKIRWSPDSFVFSVHGYKYVFNYIKKAYVPNTKCLWADPPSYNTMGL